MKCKRVPLEVEVEKYVGGQGMEDGFELLADVVTKGWIVTEGLIEVKRPNGEIVCPYIEGRRGKTFIMEGDYIVTYPDGFKNVVGNDKVWTRYEEI